MKVICNILQHYCCMGCGIIQQFSSGGEFGGTFLCDSPLPAITWLWLVHVILTVICLTDQDSQSWKIKRLHSSIQWCDSDYLTFSSQCFNMSHGICSRYYLWGVIFVWRRLCGVSYFDSSRLQQYYCRVCNYAAIFIWWWIWVHISMWQSLPAITWLWLVHVILMVICLTDQDS